MSYESKMLEQLNMPTKQKVEQALLKALLKHGGIIKEFGSGKEIVDEIAEKSAFCLFGNGISQREPC